ncbi:MAG: HAMP domain-containing protein [Candidatus Riflebacteria bacterium]|nr:HAMP domain-containing protein [Candidatus Riflebacteria bacterium]
MSKTRRKTYLIKKGLQLRYMGIIVTSMLTVAACVGWIFYKTSWGTIADTPDLSLANLGAIYDQVNQTLLQWIILIGVAIAILSLFVSHKIAGPVYRIEETAKRIAKGDLSQTVHLRHGDELGDLQDAFNAMTVALRNTIKKDREVIERLLNATKTLKEELKSGTKNEETLKKHIEELDMITEEMRYVTRDFKLEDEDMIDLMAETGEGNTTETQTALEEEKSQ